METLTQKFTIGLIVLFAGTYLWSQTPEPFRAENITPAVAHYEIRVGATPIAKATAEILPLHAGQTDTLVYRFTTEGLFKQNIEVVFLRRADLLPLRSLLFSQRGETATTGHALYTTGRVEGGVDIHGLVPRSTPFAVNLSTGVIDLGMLRLAVTALPLHFRKAVKLNVFDLRQGKPIIANGWVARIDTVTVPAGSFQCYRLELFVGDTQEIDYLEAAPPFRLIRQVFPANDIEMRLLKD